MHFDLTTLMALAVFVHLGTSLASTFLHSRTDQAKIAVIDAKTDQVLALVTAIAPAIPTRAPKTIVQAAADVAGLAQSIASATAPVAPLALSISNGGTN
jgi:hypothetical protein